MIWARWRISEGRAGFLSIAERGQWWWREFVTVVPIQQVGYSCWLQCGRGRDRQRRVQEANSLRGRTRFSGSGLLSSLGCSGWTEGVACWDCGVDEGLVARPKVPPPFLSAFSPIAARNSRLISPTSLAMSLKPLRTFSTAVVSAVAVLSASCRRPLAVNSRKSAKGPR